MQQAEVSGPNGNNGGNSSGNTSGNNGGGIVEDKPYLTVENFPDVINLFSELAVQAICKTNYKDDEIKVTASESWPIITKNGSVINISVPYWGRDDDNNVPAPRSCTVTISAGTLSKTAKLVQESDKASAGPALFGQKLHIKPIGETIRVPIYSDCISWKATTEADWITLKVLDNYNLEIKSSPRPDNVTKKRTADITVCSSINWHFPETFTLEETDPEVGSGDYGYDGNYSDWD